MYVFLIITHDFSATGHSGMEIAVLLLLTLPLTAATPLRPTHRLIIIYLKTGDDLVNVCDVLKSLNLILSLSLSSSSSLYSMAAKLRPRRECHLGTCQVHNLASRLYNFSKKKGKEESKNADDPQGYGR
uniref:Uncharacterized protein n=1 Tax=Dicentrarchus labrax TaxID=13489 RepID=A0A8P4G1I2_DICLA